MNSPTLSNRVAAIAGGATELGVALRVALQTAGAQVVVGNGSNFASTIAQAVATYGRLDILVNTHTLTASAPAETMPLRQFMQGITANLSAMFFGCQAAAQQMMKQSPAGGCIINVASVAGVVALPGHSDFCAAMAGVNAITKTLATEWQPQGIRVVGVGAGLSAALAQTLHPNLPDGKTPTHRRILPHTLTNASDVAQAVVYLASDAARQINGITLYVDGGWLADGYWE